MKSNWSQRILSLVLCVCMAVGCVYVPTVASAQSNLIIGSSSTTGTTGTTGSNGSNGTSGTTGSSGSSGSGSSGSTSDKCASGHSFGDWTTVKDATCVADGERKHTCSVCGETVSETILAKGHVIDATGTCTVCGKGTSDWDTCAHDNGYSVNGFCLDCGMGYEPAKTDSDGAYRIDNAGQLYWLAQQVAGGKDFSGETVKLTADIVVNPGTFDENGNYTAKNGENVRTWTPIGSWTSRFCGTFDGAGHTVSGLYYSGADEYVALIGCVDGGTVKNVAVKNAYFYSSQEMASLGGVVGWSMNGGAISGCMSEATVAGSDRYACIGGVVGYLGNVSTMNSCYGIGKVSGISSYVSGVLGRNYQSTATNCFYLDTCGAQGEGTSVTEAQLASGEVTWKLNGESAEGVWKQTLGENGDAYPNFTGKTVYYVEYCNGTSAYANSAATHAYANGFCTACGGNEEPTKNASGAYEIDNAGKLYWFAAKVNGGETTINAILTDDIVVNANVLGEDGNLVSDTSGFRAWTPIGNSDNSYEGTFDGDGKTISGLYFNNSSTAYVGLFGKAYAGKVQNVGVEDSYFYGRYYVGGVVGAAFSSTTVTNCYNTGTVSGSGQCVGGVVGVAFSNATVTNCYNTGAVSANNQCVGGVVGQNSGTVTNCYNTGKVTNNGTADGTGGVVGWNEGTVTNCYNTGDVSGYYEVGGVVGVNSGATITNCYNTGKVSGDYEIGGVAGYNNKTITDCYYLTGCATDGNGTSQNGIGNTNKGSVTENVAGQTEGVTAAQFASGEVAYKLNAGQDTTVWYQGKGAPAFKGDEVSLVDGAYVLTHKAFVNGFCTVCDDYEEPTKNASGVYEIDNAGKLYWFANFVNQGGDNLNANAKLTADITVNKGVLDKDGNLVSDTSTFRTWTPIGNSSNMYAGTFDGAGHTVSGLYFNDSTQNFVGLFGLVGAGGTVKNVTVKDAYFRSNSWIGGVAGRNNGTVTGCTNFATITGGQYVGGIVGTNSGTITNCANFGAITGTSNSTGGVVGFNSNSNTGLVANCYNAGTVSGNYYTGGVVGSNYKTVESCYNIGTVSGNYYTGGVAGNNGETVTNCYYLGAEETDDIDGTTAVTAAQLAEAELTWKLNGEKADGVWKLTIGTDKYPNFTGKTVYYGYRDCGDANPVYDNSPTTETRPAHQFDNNGFCTVCEGGFKEPSKDDNGVYQIQNAGQLYWFAALVNGTLEGVERNVSANAKLTADIVDNRGVLDADGELVSETENFRTWTVIAQKNEAYDGTFDGAGHSISGLYYNNGNADKVGLFGRVGDNGMVKDLTVKDSYFCGRNEVGGVAGANSGTITGCVNFGTVQGTMFVGGVAGLNEKTVEKCSNGGAVSGQSTIGGVVGNNGNEYSLIRYCYNTGAVTGDNTIGGIVGQACGTIKDCYSVGTITSGNEDVCGGVIGVRMEGATYARCYYLNSCGAWGPGTSTSEADFTSGKVAYLLNLGDPDGIWKQNLGTNGDKSPNFTSAGKVYAGYDSCGNTEYQYANSAFDHTDAPPAHSFDDNGFCVKCSNGYHSAKYRFGVYEIYTAGQLYWFAQQVNNGNADICGKLMKDITVNANVLDANGAPNNGTFRAWTPIGGEYPYSGTFDGNGHSISGLYINANDGKQVDVGLFAMVDGATIKNVSVKDTYFAVSDTSYATVGGIVGAIQTYDKGAVTIANCAFSGVILASLVGNYPYAQVGGIVGRAAAENHAVTIKNCTNAAAITVTINATETYTADVGGIVGQTGRNDGVSLTIANCTNSGNLTLSAKCETTLADGQLGGVVGYAVGEIQNCGNTGALTVESSGWARVGGVTGQTESDIRNCFNTGAITVSTGAGQSMVGGVVGYNFRGTVENCYNTFAPLVSSTDTICAGGLIAFNDQGTLKNCYYLNTIAAGAVGDGSDDLTKVEAKTAEDFENGKVAWLLNGEKADGVWKQNLGENGSAYPNFTDEGKVYCGYASCTDTEKTYGNSALFDTVPTHDFTDNNGFCKFCDKGYEEPAKDDDGYYLIDNAGKLYWFADFVNKAYDNKKANAKLTADIVVNKDVLTEDGTLNGDGSALRTWLRIPIYQGTFDGQDHTISGLYYSSETDYYVGFFGSVTDATLKNIHIVDSYFYGSEDVGGIAGMAEAESGDVTITNCSNAGYVGGKTQYVGGIVGSVSLSEGRTLTIENCYNTGNVGGTGKYVGGVIGQAYSTADNTTVHIRNCHNTGTISSTGNFVGGVVGGAEKYGSGATLTIENCYNTGKVSSTSKFVGGVVGSCNSATVMNCYSTGAVSGDYSGVFGYCMKATIGNCYFLDGSASEVIGLNVSGNDVTATAMNKTDFESGKVAYLLNGDQTTIVFKQNLGANADPLPNFTGATVYYVAHCDGSGYAYANSADKAHNYANGFCACGDCEAPVQDKDGYYLIDNAGKLYWFAKKVNGGETAIKGKLTADITVNANVLGEDGSKSGTPERTWTPIGNDSKRFVGTFDGNDKTISGLYFENTNQKYVGLFGYVGENGAVKNVTVKDSYFRAGMRAGGIVGYNVGTVSNCAFSGTINNSGNCAGGIAGYNTTSGVLEKCHNSGTISGTEYVGGVAGHNYGGVIKNCYNTGAISGDRYIGGVVASGDGTVENCYNTGNVSGRADIGSVVGWGKYATIINCYYLGTGETDGLAGTTYKTADDFKDGTVTWLLNGKTSEGEPVWKQTLDDSSYPGFKGEIVYKEINDGCSDIEVGYTNTKDKHVTPAHDFTNGGFCTCGLCEAPTLQNGYYLIDNAGKLYWFANYVNAGNTTANAILTADIVVNNGVFDTEGNFTASDDSDRLYYWTPIGGVQTVEGETVYIEYAGIFDGASHSISGLNFKDVDGDYVGLFGIIGEHVDESGKSTYGTVKNLTVKNSYFCGRQYIGAIAGYNGGGTIDSCHGEKNILRSKTSAFSEPLAYPANEFDGLNYCYGGYVGGIVGENGGTVTKCSSDGTIGATSYQFMEDSTLGGTGIGGIVGFNREGGTVTACTNSAMVSAQRWDIGGVVGTNRGAVTNCTNNGSVSGAESYSLRVGGIVGYNTGSITRCLNFGDISAEILAGGVVGENIRGGIVTDCGNTGAVSGTSQLGGVAGTSVGTIKNCFNKGNVFSTDVGNGELVGGVVGSNSGTVINCYYKEGCAMIGSTMQAGIGCMGEQDYVEDEKGIVLPIKVGDFSSGKLTYLLNGGKTDGIWKQTIGEESLPNYTGKIVYSYVNCIDGVIYSNVEHVDGHHGEVVNGFCPCGAYCEPCEGSGTKDDPYLIKNAGNLYWFAAKVNDGRKDIHGKLVENIVVNENVLNSDGELIGTGSDHRVWTPIGKAVEENYTLVESSAFVGCFDGDGHSISGLYFSGDTAMRIGLIGYLGKNGTVKNVTIRDTYFYAGYGRVGSMVGYNVGMVENCHNYGTIKTRGGSAPGGVVGRNEGLVTGCSNSGSVVCTGESENCGGIVGVNSATGTVTNCVNTESGSVSGYYRAGGVVGENYEGVVENCYNLGTVSGKSMVGGVVADNLGTVKNCYSVGTVSGSSSGGVVGINDINGYDDSQGIVENCYSLTTPIGINNGTSTKVETKTEDDFKSGAVTYLLNGEQTEGVWKQNLGENGSALPNFTDEGKVYRGYQYCDDSGTEYSYANAAFPEVRTHRGYDSDGFCTGCGSYQPATWNEAGGFYWIKNAGNLFWFAQVVNGEEPYDADGNKVAQNQNANAKIDEWATIRINSGSFDADGNFTALDGKPVREWKPIQNYGGTFNGNQRSIYGVYINTPDATTPVGLFGTLTSTAQITYLALNNSYISGGKDVGGIAGVNYGTIHSCTWNGLYVKGTENVGGVVGSNLGASAVVRDGYGYANVSGTKNVGGHIGYNTGTICGSTNGGGPTVSGTENVGGIVGYNEGTVADRKNDYGSTVSGQNCVGGIVGRNNGTVKNCTNSGTVSLTVTDTSSIFINFIGGIVGLSYGTVENCTNSATVTGTVSGSGYSGGVAGGNQGTITGCTNSGAVSGDQFVGGIVGINHATVENCTNSGTVTGTSIVIGGVVGHNASKVNNCYNTGTVTGESWYVGGVVGKNDSTVTNCYNTGTVTSESWYVGGVAGGNQGAITNCYNTGTVTGKSQYVGGVVGENGGTVTNCYYRIDCATDGNEVTQNGIGNEEQGQTTDDVTGQTEGYSATVFASGAVAWLLNGRKGGEDVVWKQTLGTDGTPNFTSKDIVYYGYFTCKDESPVYTNDKTVSSEKVTHKYENGFCTLVEGETHLEPCEQEDGVYIIQNAGNFFWFADLVNGGEYGAKAKLADNIDLESRAWTPIGTADHPYTGTFDGAEHTISGLKITATSNNQGLFGVISGATVKNFTVKGKIDIAANIYNIGGVVGHAIGKATIEGITAEVDITDVRTDATDRAGTIGGIVGSLDIGSTVNRCVNRGDITFANGQVQNVGGVVGSAGSTTNTANCPITYCENYGNVTVGGTNAAHIGGILGGAGDSGAIISYCINHGNVTSSGTDCIGGIAAYVKENSKIEYCGNLGTITCTADGDGFIGGILGYINNTAFLGISNCFNYGSIVTNEGKAGNAGAILGRNKSSGNVYSNNYYLESSCTRSTGSGNTIGDAYSVTKTQFETGEVAYKLNGGKDAGEWKQTLGTDGTPNFTSEGKVYYGYEKCAEQKTYSNEPLLETPHNYDDDGFCTYRDGCYQPCEGEGTAESPYLIGNAGQLFWFAQYVNAGHGDACAKLTADIDLENRAFTPIGRHSDYPPELKDKVVYSGTFDGDYHVIKNLNVTVTSTYEAGLFSRAQDATLKNFGVINATVTQSNATDIRAGVIAGEIHKSTVTNVFTAGEITVTTNHDQKGGIAGECAESTLTNCFTTYGCLASNGTAATSVTNCFYQADGANGASIGMNLTKETFESGYLAHLFNGNSSDGKWKQTIGTDGYASFTGETVYGFLCCDRVNRDYANTQMDDGLHRYRNGFCKYCDGYEKPAQDEENCYLIDNAGKLYWFADFVNKGSENLKANAKVTDDITVNENVLVSGALNGDGSNFRVWTPIGSFTGTYKGTFDGTKYDEEGSIIGSYSISGLYFNNAEQDDVGLFGVVEDATIRYIRIADSYFCASAEVGGIAGYARTEKGDLTIRNCANEGVIVSKGDYAGGIVGIIYAQTGKVTLSDCSNSGNVSGAGDVGGVFGDVRTAMLEMSSCSNSGNVSGTDAYVGGVLGSVSIRSLAADTDITCTISDCSNSGAVTSTKNHVGGVVGYASVGGEYATKLIVENCRNSGTVTSTGSYVGGVIGYGSVSSDGTLLIRKCHNTNSVIGASYVGGVVGYALASNYGNDCNVTLNMENCDNTGAVTSTAAGAGGVVGSISAGNTSKVSCTAQNCFSTGTVNGSSNVGGVVGNAYASKGTLTVKNCYNTGDLTATATESYENAYAGGVVGYASAYEGTLTVENCYNTGNLTVTATGYYANAYAGGVVGNAYAYEGKLTVQNCYNTGDLTATATAESTDAYAGGVVGYAYTSNAALTVENCYYLETVADDPVGYQNDTVTVTKVESKTEAEFESGLVTWLLNGERSEGTEEAPLVWKQTVDGEKTDPNPNFTSKDIVYYGYENCSETKGQSYGNATRYADRPDHNFVSGECTVCGKSNAISVTIVWTSMSFSYTDGEWDADTMSWKNGGWSTEGGTVTVTNNSATNITATFAFVPNDAFTNFGANVGFTLFDGTLTNNQLAIGGGGTFTVNVKLTGKPSDYIETITTVGTITITLGAYEGED